MMIANRKFSVFLALFLAGIALLAACTKAGQCDCVDHPTGITRIANPGQTDCSLDRCDEKRQIVFTAEDAEGTVSVRMDSVTQTEHYTISFYFPGSIDGVLDGDCCNETDRLKAFNGKKVRFSGEYHDGCGLLKPIYGGQDLHFLHLSKIDTL